MEVASFSLDQVGFVVGLLVDFFTSNMGHIMLGRENIVGIVGTLTNLVLEFMKGAQMMTITRAFKEGFALFMELTLIPH